MKPVLYLDHDVHQYFVDALRRRAYEAYSTREYGNEMLSDEAQMAFAAARNWVVVSYNVRDYAALHGRWASNNKQHAGIVLASQLHPMYTLQRLFNLLYLVDATDLTGNLFFLGSWLDV